MDPYEIGLNLGREFVNENQECLTWIDPETGEAFTPSGLAHNVFEHYSQHSPWEFTAAAFNDSPDPEGAWDAFEQGLSDGAEQAAGELEEQA